MQKIFLVGGDRRQQYLEQILSEKGFSTYSLGLLKEKSKEEFLKALGEEYAPTVLLPLPATRDGKTVFMPLSPLEISFEELFSAMGSGAHLLGFSLPEGIKQEAEKKKMTSVDFFSETVVYENAVLTARATKMILKRKLRAPLAETKIAVTGFGHVGKALLEVLLPEVKSFTVFARKEAQVEAAKQSGANAELLSALPQCIEHFDAVINTVPFPILTAEILEKSKEDTLFLELASKPFGIDFAAAEALPRTAILAAGLPGKYFPFEAAAVLSKAMENTL